ncbi:MAG: EAL domain-containing protein [Ruminococcus sp.]|nr:EAL domain-containing protein [Ruminococcus sp.]
MNDLKKRKKRRKKLLKSRAASVTVTFCVFFIFAAMLTGIFFLMCMMTLDSQVSSNLDGELERAVYIEKMYANSTDEQEALNILDNAGMEYILTDNNGSILHQNGNDTRAGKEVKYLFYGSMTAQDRELSDEEFVRRYTFFVINDRDSDVLRVSDDDDDGLDLDCIKYAQRLFKSMKNSGFTEPESDSGDKDLVKGVRDGYDSNIHADDGDVALITSNESFVEMPLWVKMDIPDKGQTVYLKCIVSTRVNDLMYLMSTLVFFAAVLVLMLLAMIIVIIRGIINIRKMRNLLFTDFKTRGNNGMWFIFHAERIVSRRKNSKAAFALVDLEFVGYRRFCACNSVDEGEAMLRAVYDKLSRYTEKKELLAHNAEDSFALMLRVKDEENAKSRAQMILKALGEVLENSSLAFHAGIYIVPAVENAGIFTKRKNVDIERDFNNACTACSALSDSESSGYSLYNEKFIEEQRWIDTVNHMQQAALDNEEFLVYYQPKYDPRTHELRGAEALIRWQSPQYGFLSPYRFIPIFEKNGFITEIDHYMIAHVARDQKKWLDEGQKCVPVSVNVSRAHFIESDLAEQIRDIVDKEGAPHHLIEIELTESAFFDDKKAMINTIGKLKEYGFAVSMDDFGSGYSSLNSLKDMPLDVLKLDAEFFRGEEADTERGEAVVSEAIRLAKSLNMRTVAEGVEVKEQVEFLASQGCDMIQGYYFAKPMPGDEYRERMIQGKNDCGGN